MTTVFSETITGGVTRAVQTATTSNELDYSGDYDAWSALFNKLIDWAKEPGQFEE